MPNLFSKKSFQNSDFEVIYLLSVNTYHTSAVVKCIPQQSSFIMLKFQQNRMKPELIRILFVTSLDKGRHNVSVKKIHDSQKLNGNIFVKLFFGDWLKKKTKQKRKRDSADPIIYSVSMNHRTNTCSSSTIDKKNSNLSGFPKTKLAYLSVINLIIYLPAHISCGRDMTELNDHKAQPKRIFSVGTKILIKTEPQSETEKIALSCKNWNERSKSTNPTNIEQKQWEQFCNQKL